MKIVDAESGRECPPGELGEIAIRGPNVMIGYWNRPQDTARAIRDGWFHSGDIGRQDEDGFFFIVDRVKDMITVGGLKVYPAEVERVLLDHPLVSQAAVVGIPDPVFGEQVVAFIRVGDVADRSQAVDAIHDHARNHLGNYKVPRRIELIEELPRNPSGKVLKTVLREQAAADRIAAATETRADRGNNLRPASLRTRLQSTHASERARVATEFVQQLVQEIGQDAALPRSGNRVSRRGAGLVDAGGVERPGASRVGTRVAGHAGV